MKITWRSDAPVWVPQWPLSKEKLLAAQQLVQEQLDAGHIKPSTSPFNTPIFIIKKKSGKWRLLHDLRAINASMQPMGPTQLGLPLLTALPTNWPSIVIDIKDCFFSIPLHPSDTLRFAFTVPSINHVGPDQRFEWTVLLQGMANSPTMCQIFVDAAIKPLRERDKKLIVYHYMDDILIAHPDVDQLKTLYVQLSKLLEANRLLIAPEKVQLGTTQEFLGTKLTPTAVRPLKVTLRLDHLRTLNDFQKLLGDINWIRSFLRIPTSQLSPLFDILKGDPHPTSES